MKKIRVLMGLKKLYAGGNIFWPVGFGRLPKNQDDPAWLGAAEILENGDVAFRLRDDHVLSGIYYIAAVGRTRFKGFVVVRNVENYTERCCARGWWTMVIKGAKP